MSKYVAKAAIRQAKNYTKGYTDIQVKVREATSNDPWGPSGSQMTEIAESTFHAHDFMEIMDIIDKRLNDSGKNWRHVFKEYHDYSNSKALTLLDYLIHCGSEQVIAYAKQNLYVIKTLKEFQFIDEEGKDQGLNVREKSKNIAALLSDDDRLREERKSRAQLRDKMHSVASPYGNESFGAQSQSGGQGGPGRRLSYAPSSAFEEERQLERAIEESKRAASEQERKARESERQERELARAIESSRSESSPFPQQTQQQQFGAPQQRQTQDIDLWGANTDQSKHDMDFFTSMAAPAAASQVSNDPFGLAPAPQQSNQLSLFDAPQATQSAVFAQPNPFGQNQAFSQSAQFGQANASPFGNGAQFQQQNMFVAAPSNAVGFPQAASQSGFNANFDAGFDGGAGQKNLVPRHLQGQQNPNAQLAQIARNSSQIDPFANLANNPVPLNKAGSNKSSLTDISAFGSNQGGMNRGGFSTMQPTPANPPTSVFQPAQTTSVFPGSGNTQPQQQQPRQSGNDPFASLSPFPTKTTAATPSLSSQQSFGSVNQGKPLGSNGSMMGSSGFSQHPQQMGMAGSNAFGQQQQMGGNPFGQQQQQQRPQAQPQQSFGMQGQPGAFGQQQSQNNFFF